MAFELKVDIEVTCECMGVRLKNTSGVYDAVLNPFGWDEADASGNPKIANIVSALADFTFHDGTVLSNVDISDFLSTSENWVTFTTAQLGSPGYKIPDKLGSIRFHLTGTADGDPFDYITTVYFYPICRISCCVKKMANNVKIGMSVCKDKAMRDFIEAKAWLDLIDYARAECCDIPRANEIYALLKKICSENNFTNC